MGVKKHEQAEWEKQGLVQRQTQGGQRMTMVFGVTELMGRWGLWLQMDASESVTAGLTLQGGRGAGSSRGVGEGGNKGPGVLHWDCEDWRPRVLE